MINEIKIFIRTCIYGIRICAYEICVTGCIILGLYTIYRLITFNGTIF